MPSVSGWVRAGWRWACGQCDRQPDVRPENVSEWEPIAYWIALPASHSIAYLGGGCNFEMGSGACWTLDLEQG